MTDEKCIVCGVKYNGGKMGLEPCPNGHTLNEQIAIADVITEIVTQNKQLRKLEYPRDIGLVKSDIRHKLSDDIYIEFRDTMLELWEMGVIHALYDDKDGIEVGQAGKVYWTWNDDWEIIEE